MSVKNLEILTIGQWQYMSCLLKLARSGCQTMSRRDNKISSINDCNDCHARNVFGQITVLFQIGYAQDFFAVVNI